MDKDMKNPKATVLMPAYNAEAYIREAIESVLSQTFSDFEFLIINDGSQDSTADIVRSFHDPRIVFADNKDNAGVIARLNQGLSLALGEYIARIDSDDVWSDREKLAKQIGFLDQNPGYGLLGTLGTAIGKSGEKLFPLDFPLGDADIRKSFLIRNCFINCSAVLRKSLLEKSGGYDPSEKHAEDYGLWLRLGNVSKIANLPESMVCYRVTPEGDSLSNNIRSIRNSIMLAKKHRHSYPSYFAAMAKWHAKLLILRMIGIGRFTELKKGVLAEK